jgi:putative peptidoglycan lipid II flippase
MESLDGITPAPEPDEAGTSPARSSVRHLARSTVLLMVTFGIAKVISLVQVVIIAKVFGLGAEWDAFVTANSIPELLVVLIGGGALGYAFIPVFGGLLAQQKRDEAWRLASHVMNTIFIVTGSLSVLVFLTAPWLIRHIIAPGFTAEQVTETAALMRILLLSTLLFSISGIFQGILHSHNHFLLPALAPILLDVGILFGVVFLVGPLGVYGIAWGAVLGAMMHMGIQIPGLFRYRMRWWAEAGWRDPRLHLVIRLMIPRLLGLAVVSFNLFLVPNNIASRLGEGAIGAFNWGWRLMQIPETLIGSAMGFVIFPTLAALSELGDSSGKRQAMNGALRFVLVATVPSAVGLIVLGRPLVGLLERGAFDAAASNMVYSTLQFFALGLIVHSALEIVARSFYADKDTVTPLFVALVAAAINLALSLILSDLIGVGGLALSNSIAVAVEVSILVILLRRRWQGIGEGALLGVLIRSAAASLVMALSILALGQVLTAVGLSGSLIRDVIRLGLILGTGIAVYVGAALLLGLREIRDVLSLLLRKARREAVAAAVEG